MSSQSPDDEIPTHHQVTQLDGLRIVKIDPDHVAANNEKSNDFYNSNFHSIEECPNIALTSEEPTNFSLWLPLIAKSRGITDIQTITVNMKQCRLLLDASRASILTKVMNRVLKDEIDDEIKPAFERLRIPEEGLFMRTDACSPKDGVGGCKPLKTVDEILLRIVTSGRILSAVEKAIASAEVCVKDTRQTKWNDEIMACVQERATEKLFSFYFLTFDENMSTQREFRCFCAPGQGRVVAVSQYNWYKPWLWADRKDEKQVELVKAIVKEVEKIYRTIEAYSANLGQLGQQLLRQGLVFDVSFQEDSTSASLVELTIFGSRSGCWSCLFHWLKDEDLLYGKRQEIEVRIVA